MKVTLLVTNEKANARRLRLGQSTTIGRSADCHLKIASAQVSRRHCLITVEGTRVLIRDLGSANGTRLDGRPIPAEVDVEVSPGSRLAIGPLRFVVHFDPLPQPSEKKPSTTHDLDPLLTAPPAIEEETKDYIPINSRHDGDSREPADGIKFLQDDSLTEPAPRAGTEGEPAPGNLVAGPGMPGRERRASRDVEAASSVPVWEQTEADRPASSPSESTTDLMVAGGARETTPPPADNPPTELLVDVEPPVLESADSAAGAEGSPEENSDSSTARKGWKLPGFLRRGKRPAAADAAPAPPPNPTASKPLPAPDAAARLSEATEEDPNLTDFLKSLE